MGKTKGGRRVARGADGAEEGAEVPYTREDRLYEGLLRYRGGGCHRRGHAGAEGADDLPAGHAKETEEGAVRLPAEAGHPADICGG